MISICNSEPQPRIRTHLEADDVLEVLEAPLGRPGTSSAVDVVFVDLWHGVRAVLAAGPHHVALLGGLLRGTTGL